MLVFKQKYFFNVKKDGTNSESTPLVNPSRPAFINANAKQFSVEAF